MSASKALTRLHAGLDMAEALMSIESEHYKNPPPLDEQKAVEGLRGGAAILMVAAFERFLRDLFEEHLAVFTTTSPNLECGRLPEKMRVQRVFGALELAMKGEPYSARKRKVDRLADIDRACRLVLDGALMPEVFAETAGNPSSKTVARMSSNIGLNVFDAIKQEFEKEWGQPVAHTFISDKLDEIVNRRHVVAHTADALNVGREQLKDAFRFLKALADVLNAAVARQMADLCAHAQARPGVHRGQAARATHGGETIR